MNGIGVAGNQLIQFFSVGDFKDQLCAANGSTDTRTGNLQLVFFKQLLQILYMCMQKDGPSENYRMRKGDDINTSRYIPPYRGISDYILVNAAQNQWFHTDSFSC